MRKLAFYPKLALSNLWRNRGTYLPYLIACTTAIVTFYSLLAIFYSGSLDDMRGAAIVYSFTLIGIIILGIFCAVLLFWTNSFLIKRRKQELALYSILGMEKANMGVVLALETLFTALVALALGLAGGFLFSRFLYLALLRLVRWPVSVTLGLSGQAVAACCAYFGVVFLLTLLSNLRQVRLASPVALLAGARQGEREPKASWLLTLLGLVCLAAGYGIALYYQSPIEAVLFFLLAAFLVIVGTFCLFTSGSVAVLKLLRRNKGYYYSQKHFISVSGMIYRMKQNAAGLASICVLSCMVLVTVISTLALYTGAEGSLDTLYPHAFELAVPRGGEGMAEAHDAIEQTNQKYGVELTYTLEYDSFAAMVQVNGGHMDTAPYYAGDAVQLYLVRLSDYNGFAEMPAALAPGEALVCADNARFLGDALTLDGVEYAAQVAADIPATLRRAGVNLVNGTYVVVLNDADWQDAMARSVDIRVAAAEDGEELRAAYADVDRVLLFDISAKDEALRLAYSQDLYAALRESVPLSSRLFKEEMRQDWYMTNGGFMFLGIFFGVLFMAAAAMIIYYKQLSEGYDDRERFEILQKVGMGEEEVRRTIHAQIRSVFFLPLGVAVVHILVALVPVRSALLLFGLVNTGLLLACTAGTVVAYALVYALVYRRTAKTYYRIVRRQVGA